MKTNKYNSTPVLIAIMLSATIFCSFKSNAQTNASNNNDNTGKHIVDARLVGKWMWTKAADGAYYNNNGVYSGPAYGLAIEYQINADGTGTCFNHVTSTIGAGTDFTVDISSKGFFESDNQQHFGYFPVSGTYKTSKGTNRVLAGDELWNVGANKGRSYIYQKVEYKTINGRKCFEVTADNGVTDRFWKIE